MGDLKKKCVLLRIVYDLKRKNSFSNNVRAMQIVFM
jgi:hypothetical protein